MNGNSGSHMGAWVLIGLAVVVNIAGYLLNLYQRWFWFDEVLHGFTILAITYALGLWLYGAVLTGARSHPVLLIVVVACVGLAVGALWEVAEWGYDRWFAPGNLIKGKTDTIVDLVMDTIGAVIAGAMTRSKVSQGPGELDSAR